MNKMAAEELIIFKNPSGIRSGLTNCAAGIRPGRSAAVNITVYDVYMNCKKQVGTGPIATGRLIR